MRFEQGVAFTNLTGKVQLAVSMTALGGQVSLLSSMPPSASRDPLVKEVVSECWWDDNDASEDMVFESGTVIKRARGHVFTTALSRQIFSSGKFSFKLVPFLSALLDADIHASGSISNPSSLRHLRSMASPASSSVSFRASSLRSTATTS